MRHGNGLNAIWQDKCTQQSYGAFNLPLVAFSLSGDPASRSREGQALVIRLLDKSILSDVMSKMK